MTFLLVVIAMILLPFFLFPLRSRHAQAVAVQTPTVFLHFRLLLLHPCFFIFFFSHVIVLLLLLFLLLLFLLTLVVTVTLKVVIPPSQRMPSLAQQRTPPFPQRISRYHSRSGA